MKKRPLLAETAALGLILAASACRKQEPPAPAPVPAVAPAPAKSVGAADENSAALPAAASPVQAAPPDFGVDYASFVKARVLEQCALKHHEDPIYAESVAVDLLLGKEYKQDLEHVFDPPAKPGAKAKPAAPLPPDTADQLAMRNKYHAAVKLADDHTATLEKVAAEVKDCLYARETGLISPELVDRYVRTFVEVACLQRQFTDGAGKFDATGHATAAAEVFARNKLPAGDVSRYGVIFGRFTSVMTKLHAAKAEKCPDPRIAEEAKQTSGEWNGQLTGDRNGSLHLNGDTGRVKGAVQWLGATVKYADGASEAQALPVEGQIGPQRVSLYGEFNGDWVRLEAKRDGTLFSGTWTAQRAGLDKFKGTWKAEKIPAAPAADAATPAAK